MTFIGATVALAPDDAAPPLASVVVPLPAGAAADDVAVLVVHGDSSAPSGGITGTGWAIVDGSEDAAAESEYGAIAKTLDAGDITAGEFEIDEIGHLAAVLFVARDVEIDTAFCYGAGQFTTSGSFTYGALPAAAEPMLLMHAVVTVKSGSPSSTITPDGDLTADDSDSRTFTVIGGTRGTANAAHEQQSSAAVAADMTWSASPSVNAWYGVWATILPTGAEAGAVVDVSGGGTVEAEATGGVVTGEADVSGGGEPVVYAFSDSYPAPPVEDPEPDPPADGESQIEQQSETYDPPTVTDGLPQEGWGPN